MDRNRRDKDRNRSETRMGTGVRQGYCLSLIMFNWYSRYLTKEALEGSEEFRIGRQVIHIMAYATVPVLLAKEETVLQGMTDRPVETGTCCGVEMNVGKSEIMRISRQTFPVRTVIDKETTRECGIFQLFGQYNADVHVR